MKVRTQSLGYTLDRTFCCWRRRAGTLAERAGGLDSAKRFMDHGPRSHTFENYNDEGLKDSDFVDIMRDRGDDLILKVWHSCLATPQSRQTLGGWTDYTLDFRSTTHRNNLKILGESTP
jgi:hypothetical protein